MKRVDADGSVNNRFVDSPVPGQNPTLIPADMMNLFQEELVNVILGAGIALDGAVENQLQLAIDSLINTAVNTATLASALLTKIKTVDGSGSGLDTDIVRGTTPGARGLNYLAAADVAAIAALILSDIKTVDGSGSGLDTDLVRGTTPGARGRTYLAAADVATIAALILADLKTVDGAGSGIDADTVDAISPVNFLSNNTDQRITTGGTRTETIGAMAVGEVKQILWAFQNTSGASATVTIQFPASGTYLFNFSYGRLASLSAYGSLLDMLNYASTYAIPGGSNLALASLAASSTQMLSGTVKRIS